MHHLSLPAFCWTAAAGFWPGHRVIREAFSPTLDKTSMFVTYIEKSLKGLDEGPAYGIDCNIFRSYRGERNHRPSRVIVFGGTPMQNIEAGRTG